MVWRVLVAALLCGMLQNLTLFPGLTVAAPIAHPTAAEPFMVQGWNAWQRGAFAEAVRAWLAAAQRYEHARQPQGQSIALMRLAHAYQALGQYRKALQNLLTALELAQQAGDRVQAAAVLGGLGQVYLVTGPPEAAQNALQDGLRLAREAGQAELTAAMLNDLGNVLASQHKYGEALDAYVESVQVAEQSRDRALVVRALTNAAVARRSKGNTRPPGCAWTWLWNRCGR